jgi:uncharacterized phage protein (TIGR01671 family)
MREIKFRCWFRGPDIMGKVTNLKGSNDGYLFDGVVAECFIGGRQVFYEAYQNFDLMQYTGLHDKNGKEIYEGDIVRTPVAKSVIEFDGGMFGLNHDYGTDRKTMLGSWGNETNLRGMEDGYNRDIEVIGNIYEHPELIKETSKA